MTEAHWSLGANEARAPRVVRPSPFLMVAVILWVVPGAVFADPANSGLVLVAGMLFIGFAWFAVPLVILIGGLTWIGRILPAGWARRKWITVWASLVVVGVPLTFRLPDILPPIGRGVITGGITGSPPISVHTGDLIVGIGGWFIFGMTAIGIPILAARSANKLR